MAGLSSAEKKAQLASMSYQDYLLKVVKVDKRVLLVLPAIGAGNFCVGADAIPRSSAGTGHPASGDEPRADARGRARDLPGGQHGATVGPAAAPSTSRMATRRLPACSSAG